MRLSRLIPALLAALLLASPVSAQQVPPLETPDVTTLLAPPGSDADTLPDSGSAAAPAPEAAPVCGTQPITIARMAWPSAALLAEIHARLLKSQFDCTVEVIPTDMGPALSGMAATGQPAVAPEMWIDRVADQWNQASKDQKLRQVGLAYAESQFEGWYVPDYVAAAHPELKSAGALKQDWQLFANGAPGRNCCPARPTGPAR